MLLLLLVSMIGFALLHLAPGGPLAQFALTPGMSQQAMELIAHQMGLDQPLPVQYLQWLRHLLRDRALPARRDSESPLHRRLPGAETCMAKSSGTAMIQTTETVVVVGASTGGTEALREFLGAKPPHGPEW